MATERATPNLGHISRLRHMENLGRGSREFTPARKRGRLGLMGDARRFRLTVIGHRGYDINPASLDWLEKRVDATPC